MFEVECGQLDAVRVDAVRPQAAWHMHRPVATASSLSYKTVDAVTADLQSYLAGTAESSLYWPCQKSTKSTSDGYNIRAS